MSMHLDPEDDGDVMSEINMTPLVDVMLVLLIIFIVTIPVMNHAVKLDLPRASSQPQELKPERIDLSIDADGKVFWNREAVTAEALQGRFSSAAARQPQPEVHLRADKKTDYEHVAQVLSTSSRLGLTKLAFVTDPAR